MNNQWLYIPVLILAFMFLRTWFAHKQGKSKIKNIIQNGGQLLLVDVRQADEFKSGSAKGAINIPLAELQKRIKEFQNQENIVVFCRSGNRSGQAAAILKQNKIQNVINGGTWQNVAAAIGD
jgi:phage shock protein E